MPQGHLFTTADVARAFGVGASTVKRWTEEGELEAAKTPGRHRRYTLAALRRFAAARRGAHVELFDALRRGDAERVRDIVAAGVIPSGARDLLTAGDPSPLEPALSERSESNGRLWMTHWYTPGP